MSITDNHEDVQIDIHESEGRPRNGPKKQRRILALALLTQVTLQWTWGLVMFVSPSYSQTDCSGNTVALLFFVPLTAKEIDYDGDFFVWALWLVFNLGITLYLTTTLALSGGERSLASNPEHPPYSSHSSPEHPADSSHTYHYNVLNEEPSPSEGHKRRVIFWGDCAAVCLWILYIILSELQIQANCIFTGENDFGGFGQVSITVALCFPAR